MTELSLEEEQAIRDRCKHTNRGRSVGGLTMYDCPVCTKAFVVHNETVWVYKRKRGKYKKSAVVLYFCSYGCMRTYDRLFDTEKEYLVLK